MFCVIILSLLLSIPISFGLFEAMSAIEMMDPKMDAGMVSHKTGHKVLNFEQSVSAGRVKIKDLELPELIGIIDTTLACMVSRETGGPVILY